jgi:hypothetical protein
VSEDKPTCADCRHWKPLGQRAYRVDGRLEKQAPCIVEYPQRAATYWRWNWESCDKFAPELREYPKEQAA